MPLPNTCQIIAEVGSVHDGSFGNALRLIDVSAQCGVDAVKFQTHISAAETLRDAPMPPYFKGEPRFEYFDRTGFARQQWVELRQHSHAVGLQFISSPFSTAAIDLLEDIGVDAYKVASGEVTNIPLLDKMAQTGKPIILSSGMSAWAELDEAVDTIVRHNDQLTILQCTSAYPCAYEDVGLNVMLQMKARYGIPVGLSDHTLTPYASFAAVTLGATVVEKHLTFSRLMYGSDAKHSLEPTDFTELVQGIRAITTIMGSPVEKDSLIPRMQPMKDIFEKSVVSLVDIPAGATLTPAMLAVKKPGTGIPARELASLMGRQTAKPIPADQLLHEDDLDVLYN